MTVSGLQEEKLRREYELIGLDMDGTLLNSEKRISSVTVDALNRARREGKKVVLATGRTLSELRPYFDELTSIEYAICENGGLIYNFENEEIIDRSVFDKEIVFQILDIVNHFDIMIQVMSKGKSYIDTKGFSQYVRYHMEEYKELLQTTSEQVADMVSFIKNSASDFEKIVLVHISQEARNESRKALAFLPIEMVDSDTTSLEITPQNVAKGIGFKKLCALLKIPLDKTIAVGDAENDRSFLACAGLAVAVANAEDSIKKFCDVVVADNDHDGCQEVIDWYLLKEK